MRGCGEAVIAAFALRNLYYSSFDTVRGKSLNARIRNAPDREIKVADDLDAAATCRFGESFPDGPVPAALPRRYRARRMGIDATRRRASGPGSVRGSAGKTKQEQGWKRRKNRDIREKERIRARRNKNNRNGNAALEMPSQARRREKGSDRRRHPGLAEGD